MRRYLLLLLALCSFTLVLRQTTFGDDDVRAKELQAAINQYIADYDAGDVNKVMGHWTENADFVDIHGEFHEGRDLISALFRRGFADHPGRKLKLTSASRKFLAPNVAMDDGVLELIEPDDGEKHHGRYTVVWTKVDDRWLIRSARDIPIEEVEPTEPQPPPLEELGWLVGKWEAKSEEYNIALDCDWQWDKNYLVQKFHVTGKETDFHVLSYITFDPVTGKHRSWFFV